MNDFLQKKRGILEEKHYTQWRKFQLAILWAAHTSSKINEINHLSYTHIIAFLLTRGFVYNMSPKCKI